MGPTWGQFGTHLELAWTNLGQLGPSWDQLRPTRANMSQRGPTCGQFEASMDLKIIEKPLFFLGFFSTFQGNPWKALGTRWGTHWERLGEPLGTP